MSGAKYYNESRKNSTLKHKAAHYHRVPLDLKNEYYNDVLKPSAESVGESVNGFIKTAIAERIERLQEPQGVIPDFDDPPEETTREPVDFGA